MKEEEIEKGDCAPPTRKVFFWEFVGLEAVPNHLAGDLVPLVSSPKKSQKKDIPVIAQIMRFVCKQNLK